MHSTPQFTPPTFEVTVPDPAPDFAAVSRFCAVNVAVTLRAALIASTHVPVPVHEPDQPENTYPVAATAVSVTVVPEANGAEHVEPQLMPDASDVTVPLPDFVTDAVKAGENDAVALRACDITNEHVSDVPLQSPLQPVNTEPDAAAAVSVTDAPDANDVEHAVPHEIPPTFDVTVPEPVPAFATDSKRNGTNVAVTPRAADMDSTHVSDVPVQSPLHPVNTESVVAEAVSVTDVPDT